MLNYKLIHPPLLAALAGMGHGSRMLISDGNFPHTTVCNSSAAIVYLNLRPGMLTVMDVLDTVLDAINVEAATLMGPSDWLPELTG
jgi:L-fucose mutarotase